MTHHALQQAALVRIYFSPFSADCALGAVSELAKRTEFVSDQLFVRPKLHESIHVFGVPQHQRGL